LLSLEVRGRGIEAGNHFDRHWSVNARYQSTVIPSLSATALTVPACAMLSTRLGYARPHWLATLYVDNLTNNLGVMSIQDPAVYGNREQSIISQPRTVGIIVEYQFRDR
jgi:hypothetical protein